MIANVLLESPLSVLEPDFSLFPEALTPDLVSKVTALLTNKKGRSLFCGFKLISEDVGPLLMYKAMSTVALHPDWSVKDLGKLCLSVSVHERFCKNLVLAATLTSAAREGHTELIELVSVGLPLPRFLQYKQVFWT